ncbi:MAG TPA: threonine/serine exporter family protein [Arachnia sp.]|nr:threonine/serine exporter family protein [Arachnia sp.]
MSAPAPVPRPEAARPRRRWWVERLLRERVQANEPEPAPEPEAAPDRLPLVSLVTRVGATALVSGASASQATEMILRLGLAHGVRFQVDVTYTAVTVACTEADGEGVPLNLFRTVPALDRDYARLAHLESVVDAVARGEQSVDRATQELIGWRSRAVVYRRWVTALVAFTQGASITALLGGVPLEIGVAGLATMLVHEVTARLARTNASYFYAQVVAGAIPMMLAIALMFLRSHGVTDLWALSPSLVVAAGMVTMLAGLGVVGAAQDALDGYYITAAARIVDLVMRTGGLILGVVAVLWLGVRLGVPAYLAPESIPPHHPAVQVASATIFATAVGLFGRFGPRGALVAGLGGGLGWMVYLALLPLVGGDYAVAAGGAAAVVAVFAHPVGRWMRLPAIAIVTVGIVPLMPGLILYRGLFHLVVGMPAVEPGDTAGELFLLAAVTGVMLALGSSVGSTLGRYLAQPTEQLARLALRASLRRGQQGRT